MTFAYLGSRQANEISHADVEEALVALKKLADTLLNADEFYDSLGGIIGYQAKCLELIGHQNSASPSQGNSGDVKVFCLCLSLVSIVRAFPN